MIINIELEESQEYQEAKQAIEEWEKKHHELMKDPDGNKEELQASFENRPKEAMKKLSPPELDDLRERATLQYIENVSGNYKKYMEDAKRVIDAYALADFFITTGYFKQQLQRYRSGEADIYDLMPKKPGDLEYTQEEIDFYIHGLEINSEENYTNMVYNICMHLFAPIRAAAKYGFDTSELVSYVTEKGMMHYPDPGHEAEQKAYSKQLIDYLIANPPIRRSVSDPSDIQEKPKKKYRTRSKAEEKDIIPDRLALITAQGYEYGLSTHQEKKALAYLEPLNPEAANNLRFDSSKGLLYFDGSLRPASEVQLENIKTKETIEALNLPLLTSIYSIFLNRFQVTGENRETLNIYLPDFAEFLGYGRNISPYQAEWLVAQSQMFQSVAGRIETPHGKAIYAVMVFLSYEPEKNMLTLASPYLTNLINNARGAKIRCHFIHFAKHSVAVWSIFHEISQRGIVFRLYGF